jgi:hypothetical protein
MVIYGTLFNYYFKMDSDITRDKLKKQRERWLREREIDKEKGEVEREIKAVASPGITRQYQPS